MLHTLLSRLGNKIESRGHEMNKYNDLYKCAQLTFWNINSDVASLKYVADMLQGGGGGEGAPRNSLPTNNTPLIILYTGLK